MLHHYKTGGGGLGGAVETWKRRVREANDIADGRLRELTDLKESMSKKNREHAIVVSRMQSELVSLEEERANALESAADLDRELGATNSNLRIAEDTVQRLSSALDASRAEAAAAVAAAAAAARPPPADSKFKQYVTLKRENAELTGLVKELRDKLVAAGADGKKKRRSSRRRR